MKELSLTLPITEQMTVYKNLAEKRPVLECTRNHPQHGLHETTLHLPLHTGTHVDYPLHAIAGGKTSSDYTRFPVHFSALVVDFCPHPPDLIGLEHIQHLPVSDYEALFFRTLEHPLTAFIPEFPGLEATAAAWLADQPLLFVGTDQPGIERGQPGHPSHISLLARDILIIEGLDLSRVTAGPLQCSAFTLGIQAVEAEPLLVVAH